MVDENKARRRTKAAWPANGLKLATEGCKRGRLIWAVRHTLRASTNILAFTYRCFVLSDPPPGTHNGESISLYSAGLLDHDTQYPLVPAGGAVLNLSSPQRLQGDGSNMSNLDSFVTSSRPPPKSLATSQEIRDRGSTFVGHVFSAASPEEARRAVRHLKHVTHGNRPASHEIAAWRCMVLKAGKTGLGGPDDFEVVSGYDDDEEQYAGGRVMKVMQAEGVIDAVVVVSRW